MQSKTLNPTDNLTPYKVVDGREVILLGNNDFLNNPNNQELIDQKINGEFEGEVAGFWGYIGYEKLAIIDWKGTIQYSGSGNEASEGAVLELIEQIHANHPDLSKNDLKVKERFISFDDVVFPLPEIAPEGSELPNLDLVLFLKPTNGALALQQIYDDEPIQTSEHQPQDDWEPILPEATKDHGFDRDRLHYIFEIDYPHELYEDDAGNLHFGAHVDDRFVVKLLTYERITGAKGSSGFLDEIKDHLFRVEERYELLFYDQKERWFRKAERGDINPDLKTLLLLHGTFKCTDQSFKAFKDSNWIEKEILDKGKYKQVIAFDHASVFDNVPDNVNVLMTEIRKVMNRPFAQRVNWISTSRGALLGKHLINLNSAGGVNNMVTMGDGVMVAGPGNGARIVDFIGSVRRAITVWKLVLAPTGVGAVFAELIQHSAAFVTAQPGIREQQINSPDLKRITAFKTPNPRVEILPVVGDFMSAKRLNKKLFGRVFFKVSDLIMRRKMGLHHDFVIRCQEQFDPVPYQLPKVTNSVTGSAYQPGKYQTHMINSIHGSLLGEEKVRTQISKYLNELHISR